jgi:cholera toxin transcriptional activator
MEITVIEHALKAPVEQQASKPSAESFSCLTIKTGNPDCIAQFSPALYQLILFKNGIEEKIDLGFSGSRLLERLVRNPGEVVEREELMSYAWPDRVVGQGSLNQQIYTLRQILMDEKNREIIQTLPRRGYLLNPSYLDLLQKNIIQTETFEQEKPALQQKATSADLVEVSPKTNQEVSLLELATPTTSSPAARGWPISAVISSATSILLLSGLVFWGYKSIPQVTADNHLLAITYVSQTPDDLAQLQPLGDTLSRRLSPKLRQPLRVIMDLHANNVDLICLHNDGRARSMHFHQSRLIDLANADLSDCII